MFVGGSRSERTRVVTEGLTTSERHLLEWLCSEEATKPASLPSEFVARNKLEAVVADEAPDEYGHLVDEPLRRHSLDAVRELGSTLDRHGVRWAVIKSAPVVPKPIGDVDLLVGDIEVASDALADWGYTVASREPNKVVYKNRIEGVQVALHLHAEISWEGVRYLDATSILEATRQRRTVQGSVPVPSPDDELLITAAHMLFEQGNGRVIFFNVLEFAAHFASEDIDVEDLLATADRHHWRRPLVQFLRSVNSIHDDVYGTPLDARLARFGTGGVATYDPLFKSWLFSVRTLTAAKLYRLRRIRRTRDAAEFRAHVATYFVDTLDVLAERYGITYSKKRLIRSVNGAFPVE